MSASTSFSMARTGSKTYIGLDASSILAVNDLRVLEDNVGHIVVAFAAYRANRQTMSSRAVHIVHRDVVTGGNGYAIILVDDTTVREHDISVAAEVEAIAVVSSWQAARDGVRGIASRVVEYQIIHRKPAGASDGKAVRRPVLDVQVVDERGAKSLADNEEVVWLRLATIRALPIPPGLAIAIDDAARGAGDVDVGAADLDHVVVLISIAEGSLASEGHSGASLEPSQVEGVASRHRDVVERDGRT